MIAYNGTVLRVGGSWLTPGEGPTPPAPTHEVTIGGKTYPTVIMPDGNEWLAVNLDYAWSGLSVPTSGAQTVTTPQAMYYNYDEATYGWNGYKCGLLYNWYAVNYLEQNKSTLCPGWHVPTAAEWDALITAAGGIHLAGTKLKASNVSWASWDGADDYGFAVLPAGYFNGSFGQVGTISDFWTITSRNKYNSYYMEFNGGAEVNSSSERTYNQYSVRLVKDSA